MVTEPHQGPHASSPVGHLCLLYNGPTERLAGVVSHINDGLQQGDRCLLVDGDESSLQELSEALYAAGTRVDRQLRRKALLFLASADGFGPPEGLNLPDMSAAVQRLAQEAVRDGFSRLRLVINMTWLLNHDVVTGGVAQWEALENVLLANVPASAICQYDRRKLPAAVLHGALRTHPYVMLGGHPHPNPYYQPPDLAPGEDAEAPRLNWMISRLQEAERVIRDRECRNREQAARVEAQATEQRVADVLERITDGFFALDREWRLTYVNQSAERITRIRRNALVGRRVWEAFPKALGMAFYTEYHRAAREETAVHFEEYCPSTSAWLEVDAYPTREGINVYFRDISSGKRAEQALEQSEARAQRLAEEHEKLAEIGRIISSSPTIDEVFEDFADKVRDLIDFDRMSIVVFNQSQGLLSWFHVAGVRISELEGQQGNPAEGSLTTELVQNRQSLVLQGDQEEVLRKYWSARYLHQAGLRSWLAVPLVSRDEVIGALHLHAFQKDAYSARDKALAERIALQSAGAIANAWLYSELMSAEEAIKEREERLNFALTSSRVGTWDWDIATDEVRWSRNLEAIHGLSPGSFGGTYAAFRDIVFLEDWERVFASIRRVLETGEAYNVEYRYQRTDGEVRWIEARGKVIYDSAGQPVRMTGVSMDVTDRKQTEAALRREAEERKALAEITRIVSSSLDVSQVYQRFAGEARKLLPFDRICICTADHEKGVITHVYVAGVDIPGSRVGDSIPVLDTSLARFGGSIETSFIFEDPPAKLLKGPLPVLSVVKKGLRWGIVVPLRSGNRIIAYMILRSSTPNVYTQRELELAERIGSQIAGSIANAQLYASLKEAEQEAQAGRHKLQSVLETAPVGILVVDARQQVLFANREVERMFDLAPSGGHAITTYMASAVYRKLDGTEYPATELPLQRALATGEKVWAEEVHFEFLDGRRVPVLANATPLLAGDATITGGILALQDMSALEQAQNARTEFLGVISHEMRNPLAIIKGSAATALSSGQPIDPEEARELFEIVDDEANKLKELIDNLLDINRIESGTLSIRLEPLDLATVLQKTRAYYARTGGGRQLLVEAPGDMPLVMGDRGRIEQVLLNLINNASKFSPHFAPISVRVEPGLNHVTIRVHDTGIGIPSDKLPMLFRKFTRLHTTGEPRSRGTGLGLAICKGVVEAHGGRIWAESPGEGKGATFSFTLPVTTSAATLASPGEPRASSAPRTQSRCHRKSRILVVDDELRIISLLKRALSRAGYEVIGTTDPAEAVDMVVGCRPDLMLLDITMPGMNGFEVLEQIQRVSNVPVVFLTASHSDQDRKRAAEMGASDYMTKPFSPAEINLRIESILKNIAVAAPERPSPKRAERA